MAARAPWNSKKIYHSYISKKPLARIERYNFCALRLQYFREWPPPYMGRFNGLGVVPRDTLIQWDHIQPQSLARTCNVASLQGTTHGSGIYRHGKASRYATDSIFSGLVQVWPKSGPPGNEAKSQSDQCRWTNHHRT